MRVIESEIDEQIVSSGWTTAIPLVAADIAILDDVLTRMEAHQLKKTPQLRSLHSW